MSNQSVLKLSTSIIFLFLLVALLAPLLSPYDASLQSGRPFESPSAQHWLGTNDVGQDILSEVIMGTRYSILIGLSVAVLATSIAVFFGILSGYFGGLTDAVLMRLLDFFMTIPYIPMVILLSALIPSGLVSVVLILALFFWPETTRLIRSQVRKIKQKEYILNVQAMGVGHLYILSKHVIRELSPMIAYRFTMLFKAAILSESTLSFLGLGSPTVKSWGTILFYAQQRNAFAIGAWGWWVIPPGLLITLFAFSLMLFSYSFEEKMDKRLAGMVKQ